MSISPLLVIFVALFAAAEVVKFVRGDSLWGTIDLVLACILAIVCVLTRWFTRDATALEPPAIRGRALPLQLFACALVIVATGLGPLASQGFIPIWLRVPLWDRVRELIYAFAAHALPAQFANGVANFAMYCVPIGIALLLLGVPLSQQGLGRFRRGSFASALAWLLLPVGVFAFALFSGRVPLLTILSTWVSNLLQNGASEEFLWRGAVLGRLRAVMKTEYALFAQAILFALWHAGADLHGYHGDVLNAIADMVASQALFGLAAGYVTVRTGNIAISSAFHLMFDSLEILQ